ncbi:MAG: GTP pyrophosphokinase family protein [Lachnospiraceae bacterium]|nr:GTP pyrophosphokinase family protein [Lachnospiraceae bacterium]
MDNINLEYNKFKKQIQKFEIAPEDFKQLIMEYECAILEVKTKLDVLNNEFMSNELRNPIETIKARIKSPESLYEKLERKGFEKSIDSIRNNIYDVAGVRVICPFIDDIYKVADMLSTQDDINIISRKDYIKNPKKNGYRSLHLVVEIPIFLSKEKKPILVEVQIRTIAMNFWASLEHQIHYKKFSNSNVDSVKKLAECADTIYETDLKMLNIRRDLIDNEEEE